MENKVYIIGAGGHGQVIADIVKKMGFKLVGFLDDNKSLIGHKIGDMPVISPVAHAKELDGKFVIAVGDNEARKKLADMLNFPDEKYLTVIHPSVIIGNNVRIGVGTMIVGGAVINTGTIIGKHTIINTSVSIDHHNIIGDFVHIGPGTHTGGNVTIEEGTFLGIGTSVIPNRKIGRWSVIGAGAAVISDIPEFTVAVGIPANVIKRRKLN